MLPRDAHPARHEKSRTPPPARDFGSAKLTFLETPTVSPAAGSIEFLSGDGEMARLMRGHDWSQSSLVARRIGRSRSVPLSV